MNNRKTNLFMVGVAKCGTTTIHKILTSHPEVFGGPLKEPHYFARNYIPYISEHFKKMTALTPQSYQDNYKMANKEKYLIDSSVNYILYPEIAYDIYNYNPQAKIIVVLRNPIDRIYSYYKMLFKEGYINQSFKDFLKNPFDHSQINLLEQGQNVANIEKYKQLFGDENVLIITFKQIVENQDHLRMCLTQFLDIDPFEHSVHVHENVSGIPKNRFIQFIHNEFCVTQYLKRILPRSKFRSKIGAFIMNNLYTKEDMDDDSRDFLMQYYRQELEELKALGLDL